MTPRKSDLGKDVTRRRVVKRKSKAAAPSEVPKKVPVAVPEKPAPPIEPEAPVEPDYFAMTVAELEGLMQPRQILFCLDYLKHFNGARAAENAGYSKKCARQTAHDILTYPYIQAYLSKAKEQVFGKAKLEVSDLVTQMMRLGFSDVRSLFDGNGQLKDVTKLSDDIAAAVQSIEIERRTEGRGEDKEVYYVHKIRLADKKGNLEMLGRYMQMFTKEEDDEAAALQRKADARTSDLLAELITDVKGKVKKAGKP